MAEAPTDLFPPAPPAQNSIVAIAEPAQRRNEGFMLLKPTKSGKRLAKDPMAPKKPKTAYLYFSDQRRETILAGLKEQDEKFRVSEVAKVLGDEWKALTDDDKAKYVVMAERDRQRYTDEMKLYQPSDEYKKAAEEFKLMRKGASLMPGAFSKMGPGFDLKAELFNLQKMVANQQKQIDFLNEQVGKLVADGKTSGVAPPPRDFEEYCLRVWGVEGERADAEMKRVLEIGGHAALANLLHTRYSAAWSRAMSVGEKRKDIDGDNGAKKRGRPPKDKGKGPEGPSSLVGNDA